MFNLAVYLVTMRLSLESTRGSREEPCPLCALGWCLAAERQGPALSLQVMARLT